MSMPRSRMRSYCWSSRHAVGVLPRPRDELRQRHDTGRSSNFPSVPNQYERRDALDRKARCELRAGVRVDLAQSHRRLELAWRLFEDRRHRTARPTPRCPEIDQQRDIALLGVLGKAYRVIQCQGLTDEKRAMAAAAFAALAEPLTRHPVDGVAVRTDDVKRLRHLFASWLLIGRVRSFDHRCASRDFTGLS